MPGFESIIDQPQPIRFLTNLLRKGIIPHALLFTGIEGVGKRTVAIKFAMACNCNGKELADLTERSKNLSNHRGNGTDPYKLSACDSCRSCKKIQSDNHPDIILIKPSGPFIRIGQIRALYHTLAMKPYEARLRVVIISNAQAMNLEASNALLKILEEPPDRTILILTAVKGSDLLSTIVSRCQQIRFNPISRRNLKNFLAANHGLDAMKADVVAGMADGSFSKALSMKKENWVQRRKWLINEIFSLPSKQIGTILALAEKLSKSKEMIPECLQVIQSCLRDIVIYKYCPEKIINKDLIDSIRHASKNMMLTSLLSKIEAIEEAWKNIQSNANLKLTLEVLMIRLAESSLQ